MLLISDLIFDDCNSSDASEEEEVMSSLDDTDDEDHSGGGKGSSNEEDGRKYGDGVVEGVISGEEDGREERSHVNDPEILEELVKKEDAKKMGSTEKQVCYTKQHPQKK